MKKVFVIVVMVLLTMGMAAQGEGLRYDANALKTGDVVVLDESGNVTVHRIMKVNRKGGYSEAMEFIVNEHGGVRKAGKNELYMVNPTEKPSSKSKKWYSNITFWNKDD